MFSISSVRLPFSFDRDLLIGDLLKIGVEDWITHYNNNEYEGDWAIAPLKSVAGHPLVIHAVPGARLEGFYKTTPLLERCPYFLKVISAFKCQIGSIRLMRLGAGAKILEHADFMGNDNELEIRIHIPLKTNPEVYFWLDNERIIMNDGEVWYADFNLPHRVENNSLTDRVHLVLDCEPNEWLLASIQKAIYIQKITNFLSVIGISYKFESLHVGTFLPGLRIESGTLYINPENLEFPGDILHEAGHIAVTEESERNLLGGNVGENDPNAMGSEIAAILWSYAALKHIDLPENVVFHHAGYKGQSDWFIKNFTSGNFIGLPLLEWMGFSASMPKALELGIEPFPDMIKWLR